MKIAIIVVTFLVLNELLPSETYKNKKLEKLLLKAKSSLKNRFSKGKKSWHFIDEDVTKYPGTNKKYREMNEELWDQYYNCLISEAGYMSKSVIPEAIAVYETNSVILPCKLCLSPDENSQLESLLWLFASKANTTLEELTYDENVLLSAEEKTLHFYNLQQDQTGQYVCKMGATESPPIFLTVLPSSDDMNNLKEVHPPGALQPPYPLPPEKFHDRLIVNTVWGQWTACSKCGEIGKRHRLGQCNVIMERKPHTNEETTMQISKADQELLEIFQYGIPCKSHILPISIKNLEVVHERPNEIMVGYCKVECQKAEIFEVLDKYGNVIEKVNNSAGIYSMLQKLPQPIQQVERTLQFAGKGKLITIICPGNLNSDEPVEWQIGIKKVIPELLAVESNGRIYISITDKIHIKRVKLADANIYSCWQRNNLAGTVRLIVEVETSLSFNHHIMLIGMVLVFSTFLYIFAKAFFNRQKRMKTSG